MAIIQKVQPGQRMQIPAAAYNAFVDAANSTKSALLRGGQDVSNLGAGAVLVKNATGADLGRFSIVGIDGPVISPADNLTEFQNRIVLSGVGPYPGQFAVLLEPLKAGAIGRACVSGECICKVNVTDAGHHFAEATTDPTRIESAASGSAAILYKEGGTGEKWAVVRLGNAVAASGTRLTYTFYADLLDQSSGAMWSGGGRNPAYAGETKPCWNQSYSVSVMAGGIFWWVPVRAGIVRRVSAYMTNLLAAGNELGIRPVWRATGLPCPSETISAPDDPVVILSNGHNIGHSQLLLLPPGDDDLLGVRLDARTIAMVDAKAVTGDGSYYGSSPNGTYAAVGTYNGKPYYANATTGWKIWWAAGYANNWFISFSPGNTDYGSWFHSPQSEGPNGSYSPFNSPQPTGFPRVADSAQTPYWGYVYPADTVRPILTVVVEYDPTSI